MKPGIGIHVFLSRLGSVVELEQDVLGLTSAERERLRTLRSRKRWCQFVHGRSLLRRALRYRYGPQGESWNVAVRVTGQPCLVPEVVGPMPSVSISHSDSWVACAVSEVARLGLDVEVCKPRDVAAFAEIVFHAGEQAELAGLPEYPRLQRFYELWTLKESLAKALGVGLDLSFADIGFSPSNRLFAVPFGGDACRGWCFRLLRPAPDLTLALAWQGTADGVLLYLVEDGGSFIPVPDGGF